MGPAHPDGAVSPPRVPGESPLFAEIIPSAAVLAAESGGGFHPPSLADFFPPAILFEGTIFEMNRITLVRFAATLLLILFFVLAAKNPKLVPSRMQSVGELAIDFVRKGIAVDVLGERLGLRYAPILTFIFFGVFFMNITGIIPLLNIAGSSVIGVPLLFALVAYVTFVFAGIKENGAGHFFTAQLFPAGVPKPLYLLLTPIEFLSTFILRPATLTIRLLANMIAGHMLLVLCFSATHFLFFEASGAIKGLGALTLVAGFAVTLFEIFIAALQAYVFTILTAVYIQLSVAEH